MIEIRKPSVKKPVAFIRMSSPAEFIKYSNRQTSLDTTKKSNKILK